ncbi:4-(cytidine 5'-diphospho)-2-C-methyl-D-erythritol kinase [Campylobacter majalis]|uniref:4-(cytidine 5'-diphospho)-2-C-methyl-D-erythritol kinase n=1 Tax=Campylobacter majalis TaxID=2790656 RepID=UPI003D689458
MKSYAKINIYLKITGARGDYHELSSRFVKFYPLYDELEFEPSQNFEIKSNINIQGNIILKALDILKQSGYKNELDEYFKSHKIILTKRIPMGAGLGGGSSNAATFLRLANEKLNLKINTHDLAKIGAKIGSDVSFFVYDYNSADVSGIGEIVNEFDDNVPQLQIFTPEIFCDTPSVYKQFRSNFMHKIDVNLAKKLSKMKSDEILATFNQDALNDLYAPCISLYPKISEYKDMFLSGSGSTLFKVKK